MKPKMTIMRGIAGIGKSTYVDNLLDERGIDALSTTVIASTDNFFLVFSAHPNGGMASEYQFDPGKLAQAHAACFKCCVEAVIRQRNIIVDNTNCAPIEIAPYYALAEAYQYEVQIVCLMPNPGKYSRKDLKIFAERSRHSVPLLTVERQFDEISSTLLPQYWNQGVIYVN